MEGFALFEFEQLTEGERKLIGAAQHATQLSYAPYSNFLVGTSLLLEDGSIVYGANQENASYPLCICSERVALYTKSIQSPDKKILMMVVAAKKEGVFVPAACCGACRQVMIEYEQRQNLEFGVIMQIKPQKWLKCSSASVLVPFQFEFSG